MTDSDPETMHTDNHSSKDPVRVPGFVGDNNCTCQEKSNVLCNELTGLPFPASFPPLRHKVISGPKSRLCFCGRAALIRLLNAGMKLEAACVPNTRIYNHWQGFSCSSGAGIRLNHHGFRGSTCTFRF